MASRTHPGTPLQRSSLAEQVLAHLRGGIAAGRWRDWLPTERSLALSLRVSRTTLRFALKTLRRDGTVESIRARGHRIAPRRSRVQAPPANSVGLLTPGPLHLHAPFAHVWLDHLRAELHEHGLGLVVHENAHAFAQGRPADTLTRLVRRNPHDCWIASLSTQALQAWFVRSGVPCILAGSPQEGIELPSVDVDFSAACRHAALTLLQLGHRRILFVNELSPARGYTISQAGFFQGVADYADPGVEVIVRRVRPDERMTAAQFRSLCRRHGRPTAVVVMTAGRCLGLAGCLAQVGLSIPRDVSLLCRSSGSFFEHMIPAPAHYDFRPEEYGALLARLVLARLEDPTTAGQVHRLMPKFVRGESLAAPPVRTSTVGDE